MTSIRQYLLGLPFPVFTAMVNCGALHPNRWIYPVTRDARRKVKAVAAANASVRATISFPSDLYDMLGEIARSKKVSLAWVVRDAAEQYVREKWPLFKGRP
jgi:hypothetical protein